MKKYYNLLILLIFTSSVYSQDIFIRVNQLGFSPRDNKTAIILSTKDLSGEKLQVFNTSNKSVMSFGINNNYGRYGAFPFSYRVDFSILRTKNEYYLKVKNSKSYSFKIGLYNYNSVVTELMKFFLVQRCGYTDPSEHKVCHIADATSTIENSNPINLKIDVTGGWHDAGDYTKFLNTTAFTVYTMLFSYEFDKNKFGFDENKNNVPDILEEAKIGLDWLLRANIDDKRFVTQVQDLRDHDVGWRLPEEDPLQFDRPAFIGSGKNIIGIYSATMALAGRIWINDLNFNEFGNKCLNSAINVYKNRNFVNDLDSSSVAYIDNKFLGKLALAGVELFKSTQNQTYLRDAIKIGQKTEPDNWWSWGNINAYAYYRLAEYDKTFIKLLKDNLDYFKENSIKDVFGNGVSHSWGTNNTLLGISLQTILYYKLTKRWTFRSLGYLQRDYVLGMNPWGISFISNFGKRYSKNLHHQVAYLNHETLPGGFAAGPIPKAIIDSSGIEYEGFDRMSRFQSDDAYYRDDRNDYITNEPTITANATAIFVMGYYSLRR